MSNKICGTLAQLSGKVSVNSHPLSAAQLSGLTALGVGVKVGEVAKEAGKRGRAASIWEFDAEQTLTFASTEAVEA